MIRACRKLLFLSVAVSFLLVRPVLAATPVQVIKTDTGLTAWLVEDHTNPMLALSFMFRGGASADPVNKMGLTTLLSGMLDEGAGKYDSQSFQKQLDDHNIQMSFSAGRDSFSGRLQTLTSERNKAFDLLKLALTNPRFDKEPLARMRDIFLAQLRQREERPMSRAADMMLETLFKGHPYAHRTAGSKAGLKAITAEDLHNYVQTRFAKDNLIISVVGDITPKALKTVLNKTFGSLPAKAKITQTPNTEPQLDGKIHTLSMPVPQATALFAQKGPGRNDPDWHGYQVMMYVLGDGGFSSRLTEEVREKRGLAYSVNAGSNPLLHAPLTIGSVGSKSARVGESLELIRKEWAKMRKNGPTDTEIAKAKSYLIGSLPLRFNASDTIASSLTALQYYHLPSNDLDTRADVIRSLKPEQIREIAKRWLTPDHLTTFVVGEINKMHLPKQN